MRGKVKKNLELTRQEFGVEVKGENDVFYVVLMKTLCHKLKNLRGHIQGAQHQCGT